MALIACFALFLVSSDAQTFNEILGRPTASSVTVSILFEIRSEVYWEYGVTPGLYPFLTAAETAEPDIPLEADLTGLQADTKYYFRTRYRNKGASGAFETSPERCFHTRRAPGNPFTFTVESDEHLYDKKGIRSLYEICLDNQAADHPDFMLSLGDIFGDDHHPYSITSRQVDSLHKIYRPYLGAICHSIPFYVCIGNHEGEFDYYLAQNPPENLAVYATLWRKFYYPNPYPNDFYSGNTDIEPYGMGNPENYYAWTWGDALFVVLDAYRYQCDTSAKPKNWSWSIGYPQYEWLKTTLENSNARYKFVFAHHVRGQGRGGVLEAKGFEWGGYDANGTTWGFEQNRPGWAMPIHQLFVENGVNIFFQGHDHLFAREVLDGVTYQELPMPSDTTYRLGMIANADAYISDTIEGSGHLRVNVSPSFIKVDFVRAYLPQDTLSGEHRNRETAFSYCIGDCTTAGVETNPEDPEITVYPNPATELVSVRIPGSERRCQLTLINNVGRTVMQSENPTLHVRDLAGGLYLLKIRTGQSEKNVKLIIRH